MAFCRKCGEDYDDRRAKLGYVTCLDCGSPRLNLPIVPVNKSNYVVGTLNELKQSYGHKGPSITAL